MSTLKALIAEANRLGARVQLAHLDAKTLGVYDHDCRTITIDIGLGMAQKKEALAHELGHCFYGDVCSTGANERRADRYAARLLIDPALYRAAELIDPDPTAIANELGLTRRIVRVFQREWLPALVLRRKAV